MMNKSDARILAKKLRQGLCYQQERLNMLLCPYLKDGQTVGIYYPLVDEIDLLFLEKQYPNINFVFPSVKGYNMVFKDHSLGFKPGPFNTHEPIGNEVSKEKIDLIIVPALALNKSLDRIGYGKGYYDRYLKDYQGATLAIIFKELVLDFKAEEHDVKIKEVIYL